MKKRSAKEADLPLNERARRAMMALEQALGDVVSLFDGVAAGLTGPLPVAQALTDSTFGLLDRAALVVRRERVTVVEQQWLPTELIQHIYELLIGCRRMSRVGANGVAVSEPVRLNRSGPAYSAAQTQTFRLVCKQWARAAGNAIVTISPPSRRLFEPSQVVSAFPNAAILKLNRLRSAPTEKLWNLYGQLAQLYSRRSNRPFYVDADTKQADCMDFGGAYHCYRATCGKQTPGRNTRIPLPVTLLDEFTLTPQCRTCFCAYSPGWSALSHEIPVSVALCHNGSSPPPPPDVKFNASAITLYGVTQHNIDTMLRPLFDPNNWQDQRLPLFTIIAHWCLDGFVESTKKLCEMVSAELVRVRTFHFSGTVAEFLRAYDPPADSI
jgi:hypothetical protein